MVLENYKLSVLLDVVSLLYCFYKLYCHKWYEKAQMFENMIIRCIEKFQKKNRVRTAHA